MLSGGCKYNKALIMKQRNSLAVHWLGFTALIARGWIQSLVREPGFCKQLDAVSVCVCVCVCVCISCCSIAQSCPTLCNPMDCSTAGFPVLHYLLELAQTHVHSVSDAIQPSHPLSAPSPPAFSLSQHQGLFLWVSYLHQMAKVLELQFQHQSLQWIFSTDFL